MYLATLLVRTQFVLSVYKRRHRFAVGHQFNITIIQQHGFHYGKENYLISNMKIGFEPIMAVRFLTVSAAAVFLH